VYRAPNFAEIVLSESRHVTPQPQNRSLGEFSVDFHQEIIARVAWIERRGIRQLLTAKIGLYD
jgi:hypothetical protein